MYVKLLYEKLNFLQQYLSVCKLSPRAISLSQPKKTQVELFRIQTFPPDVDYSSQVEYSSCSARGEEKNRTTTEASLGLTIREE